MNLLEDKAVPQNMSDDWITNFFDKSRIVSDGDMQTLWARVLAGEANIPGTFSKQTVNLLADLDMSDAQLFTNLCGFVWRIQDFIPLVFEPSDEQYRGKDIYFRTLTHLESIGLIKFENVAGFKVKALSKVTTMTYYGRSITLTFPHEKENSLSIGKVLLTRAGSQLVPVCGSKPIAGFFDFVYDRWAGQALVPKREV
jgi:Protein of unknown function (DUF2806)